MYILFSFVFVCTSVTQ